MLRPSNDVKQADARVKVEAIRRILAKRASTNEQLSAQYISDIVAFFEPNFIVAGEPGNMKQIEINDDTLPEIPKEYGNVFYFDLYFKPKGKYQGMFAFMYDPVRGCYVLRFTHHV